MSTPSIVGNEEYPVMHACDARRRRRLLLLLVANSWILAAVALWVPMGRPGVPLFKSGGPGAAAVYRARPGPWGTLEVRRTFIEVPEAFVPDDEKVLAEPVHWLFKASSPAELRQALRGVGLSTAEVDELTVPARLESGREPGTITLTPPRALILSLAPGVRDRLYALLGALPANTWHYEPARIRADLEREWWVFSGLTSRTVLLIKRLCYRRGPALCFSDYQLVRATLKTPEERRAFSKFLSRKSALVVNLVVRPGDDVRALAAYWGRGRNDGVAAGLLESLAARPGGGAIDIAELLGPFARSKLYTYPFPETADRRQVQDCFWTSANFFCDTPDDRYADVATFGDMVQREYKQIEGVPTLGDIVLVLDAADNTLVHACVYLAEDIVYTKNGWHHTMPWTLMTLSDMRAFYAIRPARILFMRRTTGSVLRAPQSHPKMEAGADR